MKISIEVTNSDGKDKLQLFDPPESVQHFAVASFFGYCREINGDGEASITVNLEHPKPDENHAERPEWFDTGIKNKNGIPHYRAHYWCPNPNCNNAGNQYIGLNDKTTECHVCKTLMEVVPATGKIDENGIPKQDRFNNFFIANKLAKEKSL